MRGPDSSHLEPGEVAAYVDRRLVGAVLARVEAHLADCATCRVEVIEVARIRASVPGLRPWRVLVPAAAVAAVLLLVLTPEGMDRHRELAVATTIAPVLIEPMGSISPPVTFHWSSVPKSDRYQLTVYDSAGSIVWKTQTTDTALTVADSVWPAAGQWYYWKVEARAEVGRWVASDLSSFTISRRIQ
ncbi:MAG: zf-HC2 domain-containing protein [Anaerolineales bacterium]